MSKTQDEFTVNIATDDFPEPLRGKFVVKTKLSMKEIMAMDNLRRQYLGPNGGESDGLAATIARDLAEIQIHTVDAPSWWIESKNGLEIQDVKIVLDVYDELQKVKRSNFGSLAEKAQAAKEDLKEKEKP